MKQILISFLVALSLSVASMAQDATQPSQEPPQTQAPQTQNSQPSATQTQPNAQEPSGPPRIAPGSVIPVQLTKTINAKKIKSGDEVVAQVTQDLKTNGGEVVVPKGTKVVGHVTTAQPRSKEQSESEVGIAFDRAVLKNGDEVKMPLAIQAIIVTPSANPANAGAGGYNQPGSAPTGTATGMPSGNGGRMGGNTAAVPAPSAPPTPSESSDTRAAANERPAITANTQGVIGVANLKLTATAPNPGQGSLVSSEKDNVKLESGTLMLLRVNQ
jgi:hypothetical protein